MCATRMLRKVCAGAYVSTIAMHIGHLYTKRTSHGTIPPFLGVRSRTSGLPGKHCTCTAPPSDQVLLATPSTRALCETNRRQVTRWHYWNCQATVLAPPQKNDGGCVQPEQCLGRNVVKGQRDCVPGRSPAPPRSF